MKRNWRCWQFYAKQSILRTRRAFYYGVDIHSNIVITDIIRRLKELGKPVLISSHIFSTLSDTCDVIYLLKDGEITHKVFREDFKSLELKMREFTVGDKIEKLGLK